MPTWTKEQLKAYEDRIEDKKHGPHPVIQKQEARGPEAKRAAVPDDGPTNKKVDGRLHPKFRIAVVFTMCDNRRRDLDGALATILDCVCSARRLLENNTGNYHNITKGR